MLSRPYGPKEILVVTFTPGSQKEWHLLECLAHLQVILKSSTLKGSYIKEQLKVANVSQSNDATYMLFVLLTAHVATW